MPFPLMLPSLPALFLLERKKGGIYFLLLKFPLKGEWLLPIIIFLYQSWNLDEECHPDSRNCEKFLLETMKMRLDGVTYVRAAMSDC